MKPSLLVLSALALAASGLPAPAEEHEPISNWTSPAYWGGSSARHAEGRRAPLAVDSIPTAPLPFVALTPCRFLDTRGGAPLGGGYMPASTSRSYDPTGYCGIPANAEALSVNFTVTTTGGPGYLSVWPVGASQPVVSTLNYVGGQTIANSAVLPLGTGGAFYASCMNAGCDLIADVNGYYASFSGANVFNPGQLAIKRWYQGLSAGLTVNVGANPYEMTFDGLNVWVANFGSASLSKIRAYDGASYGTITLPPNSLPWGMAFDGGTVWYADNGTNKVCGIKVSDTSGPTCYSVGSLPHGVVFDGTYLWVANHMANTVTRMKTNGTSVSTFSTGTNPNYLAFDGTNVWITNYGSNTVTKLRGSDGANLGTFAVGTNPTGIAFDGTNVWVANHGSGNVTKLRASDGAGMGTFAIGSSPRGVVFDGAAIWVNYLTGVAKVAVADGTVLATFPILQPFGLVFDGVAVWANSSGGFIQKF